jgi:CRP/FNR family cyclic AMP-dependent transcriptional regulator
MATNPQFLTSVKLFSLLDESQRASVSDTLHPETVPAGTYLFHEGEPGECLYIIEAGQVEISVNDFSGNKVKLAVLQSTNLFGETALFDPGPRSATALVLEDSRVLVWHRKDFLSFLQAHPSASVTLLAILSRRLREAGHLLMDRSSSNTNALIESKLSPIQKLANAIADFSGSVPFLFLNAIVFCSWIIINLELLPGVAAFDPYPFGFLTMSVSLEAIFLSIIVLLAQNLNSARDRIRNDVEYDVNLKAEQKVTELHKRLSTLHTEISHRLAKLENAS